MAAVLRVDEPELDAAVLRRRVLQMMHGDPSCQVQHLVVADFLIEPDERLQATAAGRGGVEPLAHRSGNGFVRTRQLSPGAHPGQVETAIGQHHPIDDVDEMQRRLGRPTAVPAPHQPPHRQQGLAEVVGVELGLGRHVGHVRAVVQDPVRIVR